MSGEIEVRLNEDELRFVLKLIASYVSRWPKDRIAASAEFKLDMELLAHEERQMPRWDKARAEANHDAADHDWESCAICQRES